MRPVYPGNRSGSLAEYFLLQRSLFSIPLYIVNRKIPLKEKLGRLVLCAFFIVSFSVNTLNFIWHGFNYRIRFRHTSVPLYILLVLLMCYEAFFKSSTALPCASCLSPSPAGSVIFAGRKARGGRRLYPGTFVLTPACLLSTRCCLCLEKGKEKTACRQPPVSASDCNRRAGAGRF